MSDEFVDDFDDDYEYDVDEDDEEPTVSCPYCRRQIHEDAQRCPYCEQYISAEDAPASTPEEAKEVKKAGLSEYFLFTIGGREDIEDNQPKRLVSMEIADVPLEVIYKLSDRTNQPVHQVLPVQEPENFGRGGRGEPVDRHPGRREALQGSPARNSGA